MAAPHGDPSSSGSRPSSSRTSVSSATLRVLEHAGRDALRLVAREPLGRCRWRRARAAPRRASPRAPRAPARSGARTARAGSASRCTRRRPSRTRRRGGPAMPASRMNWSSSDAPGDAHDQRQVRDEAVADAEDDRPQRPRPGAPVPALAPRDLRPGSGRPRRTGGCSLAATTAVAAAVAGSTPRRRAPLVALARRAASRSRRARARRRRSARSRGATPAARRASSSSPSSDWTRSATERVPSTRAARMMNRTRGRGRAGRRHGRASSREPGRPDVGVAALVRGDVPEGRRPARVLLDRGERVVEDDRVLLELEVLEALGDVHRASERGPDPPGPPGGSHSVRAAWRCLDSAP